MNVYKIYYDSQDKPNCCGFVSADNRGEAYRVFKDGNPNTYITNIELHAQYAQPTLFDAPVDINDTLDDGRYLINVASFKGGQAFRGGIPVFANTKCNHQWKLDYSSPFVQKEYHSCSKCGAKQEEL